MRVLAVIPARAGSKGIPNKNIKLFCGAPLSVWTMRQVKACQSFRSMDVVVSTDSSVVGVYASENYLEHWARPAPLATDGATTDAVLCDVLRRWTEDGCPEPDAVMLLQPTSPLRLPEDIDCAIAQYEREKADSLVSVVPTASFRWRRADTGNTWPVDYHPQQRPNRQERRGNYQENGAIYLCHPNLLRTTGCRLGGHIALYEMKPWQGYEIDEPDDWELGETLMWRFVLSDANALVRA